MAGVIVLVAVSGVVAFRGWPGMRSEPKVSEVAMAEVVATRAAAERRPVVVGSGPAAPARSTGVRAASSRARSALARRRASGDDRRTAVRSAGRSREAGRPAAAGNPAPAAAAPAAPGGDGGGSGPAPSRPDPVTRAVDGVETIVDDVTAPAAPGNPPIDVPKVVEDTTRTVEDVVQGTTDTVGGAVDSLLP